VGVQRHIQRVASRALFRDFPSATVKRKKRSNNIGKTYSYNMTEERQNLAFPILMNFGIVQFVKCNGLPFLIVNVPFFQISKIFMLRYA
jgi:hypothetical protein